MTDTLILIPYTCDKVHSEVDRQVQFDVYADEALRSPEDARRALSEVAHEAAIIAQEYGAAAIREALQDHITELETRIDELTYRLEIQYATTDNLQRSP